MSFEYAPNGLIGVLTPQANTTVEPEFGILIPRGMGLVTARLVSPKPAMESRLSDYFDNLSMAAAQFAEAPLRAMGVACTGSSYLVGPEREDIIFDELSDRKGIHVTSSALAVVAALHTLNAHRIGLVSPYPESLEQHSIAYWHSRGFSVKAVAKVVVSQTGLARSGNTNPIYAIGSDSVMDALDKLREPALDAIVMLGTGMPSLKSILQVPSLGGVPVLSCTLALAWSCSRTAQCLALSVDSLREWISGAHWRTRLGEYVSGVDSDKTQSFNEQYRALIK